MENKMITLNLRTSDENGAMDKYSSEYNNLLIEEACAKLGTSREEVYVVWGSLGGNAESRVYKGVYVVRKTDFPSAVISLHAKKGFEPSYPYGIKKLEPSFFFGRDTEGKMVQF